MCLETNLHMMERGREAHGLRHWHVGVQATLACCAVWNFVGVLYGERILDSAQEQAFEPRVSQMCCTARTLSQLPCSTNLFPKAQKSSPTWNSFMLRIFALPCPQRVSTVF
jgi:hypothetical protein